jgi:uncharacterized membrane protein YcaP (DUF421 family)
MESVFRGLAVYFVLLLVTRLSGRRSLAQVTPFDFVLLLIIAETTQQALLGDDFSVTNAFVLIVTLFFADVLMSFLKQWSSRAALLLDGTPTVLISRGRIDREAMRRARLNLDDIMKAAREQHGLRRLDQVDFAVLEVSGTLSIVPVGED